MTIKQKVDLLFKAAEGALDEAKYDRAIELMSEAILLEPKNAALVQSRGAVYAMKEDTTKAIKDYTRAIDLAPGYADAFLNRGLALWEKGAIQQAADDLEEALEIGLRAELEPQARYFLARAHEILGDRDSAYDHYLSVVVLAPDTTYGMDAAARSLDMRVKKERKAAKKKPAAKKVAPKKTPAAKKKGKRPAKKKR